MNIVSTETMRKLDQIAIEEYHIPSLQLMKQAALRLKEYIDEHYQKQDSILIACGPGNNGGDGFALALALVENTYENVSILCNVKEDAMSKDERYYAQACKKQSIVLYEGTSYEEVYARCMQQTLIVDALFGNGLSRDIEGSYMAIIEAINASSTFVLAADIASGIHSDTGACMGCAIRANVTITFSSATLGHFIYPGSMHTGKLYIRDIQIPKEVYQDVEYYDIIDNEIAHSYLPKRYDHSHKGSYGKVLLIGGSRSMHGALTLCARSMLKSGVGLLTLFLPDCISSILSMKLEECMFIEAPSEQGYFAWDSVALAKEKIQGCDTIVIGNGMGRGMVSEALVQLVLESGIPCILDGDAIYSCASLLPSLKQHRANVILTPHMKEMSYLTGYEVSYIQQHPFDVVKEFAKEYDVVVVLKDQFTYIADKEKLMINMCGNHGLAKGGSGDVLCGIISGLFAQSKDAFQSSACGVYVHAVCADLLIQYMDANSMLANDIIEKLSDVYRYIRKCCL